MDDEKKRIFDWIAKIIQTCESRFHIEAVERLINLFQEQHKDDAMRDELTRLMLEKNCEIVIC